MSWRSGVSAGRTLPAVLLALTASGAEPQVIFDGRTLTGWEGNAKAWRVEDGAITGEIAAGAKLEKNEFLYWDGEVHDFELVAEFRLAGGPTTNSGIQYRSQRLPDGHAAGYQANIDFGGPQLGSVYDEHGRKLLGPRGQRVAIAPDGRKWTDEFAKAAEFAGLLRPAGEWNTYRITARGSHVELWVNDRLCSVLDDREVGQAEFSGKIALQLHSGAGPAKVQFRNLKLTQLGKTAAPTASAAGTKMAGPVVPIPAVGADGKPLNLSFEAGTLDGWKVEGDAWAMQPARFNEPNTPRRKTDVPTDPVGNFWVGPIPQVGDSATGRLTSATFRVTQPWASFMVGGGKDPRRTRVEIVNAATGAVLHTAAGADSDILRREIVDLASVKGGEIFVRLVDEANGAPWGHVNFDDFVFHETKPDFAAAAVAASAVRQHESPVLWHLQANPARPSPVKNESARRLVQGMALTPGFQADLIAAEPDVHQPVAFAIDERGRLWVAQAFGYPTRQPEGQGKDSIVIFEDKDGDGHFETRKVFAENLNLLSGIEVGFGGVWVGAAPYLLFIPDRDGDDRPDGAPQVLLDGWGYADTHETLNSFTWGPDGWLYGVQGIFIHSYIGKPGTPEKERQRLRSGVWRYHPVRHEFEIFAHGGTNQWGLDFNAVGHLFMTTCRSFHGGGMTTYLIRNGHYWNQVNTDFAPFISNRGPEFAPGLKNFLLASARYDSGEGGAGKPGTTAVYGGHAHVGAMIYLGDNWPEIYRDHLFTHNLHGHQMNHQHAVRQGAGYESFHAGYDMLFTADPSYLPVDLQYGPDGAVYSIDWSDLQHCHNFRDDLWDRTNGRIYRMAWAEAYKPVKVDLRAKSDAELAALHTHKSEWYVRTARRLLQERAANGKVDAAAVAKLREQLSAAARAKDEVGYLRAFWTLFNVGAVGPAEFEAALASDSEVVRAWAVQLATDRPAKPALAAEVFARLAANGASPVVRLALASVVPALPAEARWNVASALAGRAVEASDRYLAKMIWFAVAPSVPENVARALDLAETTPIPTLADSIRWYAGRLPQGRDEVVARLAKAPEAAAVRGVRLLAFGLENEAALPMPKGWAEAAQRFAGRMGPAGQAMEELSVLFGDESVLARMRARLADTSLPAPQRQAALALLKRANDTKGTALYIKLLDEAPFRAAVIPMLASTDDPAAARGLIKHFDQMASAAKTAALGTLTSRPALALVMLEAVEKQQFDRKHLTALHARQLRSLGDARVNAYADRIWGKAGETSADAKATVAKLKKAFTDLPLGFLDPLRGKEVYQRLCAACHKLDGDGGTLGPDLTGSSHNGLDYFLENIVDPNAVVGADFQLNIITKNDGSVVSGMIGEETDTALVVRTAAESITVPRSEIKSRQVLEQSMMPAGLLEGVSQREALDLLRFLLIGRR